MRTLSHLTIVAFLLIPAVSFAQQTNSPAVGGAANPQPMTSSPDGLLNHSNPQYQKSVPSAGISRDSSGYGPTINGSSQSSMSHNVGKNSTLFAH
ncbi:hypothetical protein P3T23_002214 [Paraburkholderia sp. GAS448]|jgi:hypothetical protein